MIPAEATWLDTVDYTPAANTWLEEENVRPNAARLACLRRDIEREVVREAATQYMGQYRDEGNATVTAAATGLAATTGVGGTGLG